MNVEAVKLKSRTPLLLAATIFSLLTVIPQQTHAAPGDLDTTFSQSGVKTLPLTPYRMDSYPVPIAVQSDGKIILGATACCQTGGDFFLIVRLASDGSLDGTFGVDGKAAVHIGRSDSFLRSLLVQGDGKIVAVGTAELPSVSFALARFTTNGALDNSFGPAGNGTLTTEFPISGEPFAAAIQPDQEIVVVGVGRESGHEVFALARYQTNGNPDTSFGSGGKVVSAPIGSSDSWAYAVALQADNKIVVAGGAYLGSSSGFALARYDSHGGLDSSFGLGANGTLISPIGTSAYGQGVAVQTDGKIVAAGSASTGGFALVRYDAAGKLDTSFGQMGKVTTNIGASSSTLEGVVVQPDGKIVAAGTAVFSGQNQLAVARFNSDGSLDNTFGLGGKATTAGCPGARAIAVQGDGRILVTWGASSSDFCLVRFLGDSADVVLTMSFDPGQVSTGTNLTYTIMVVNNGPESASSVVVLDMLPEGVTLVAASTTQGTCTGSNRVACTLGTVGKGSSVTVKIVVRPTIAGVLTNTANVTSNTPDPNKIDNIISVNLMVAQSLRFLPWVVVGTLSVGFTLAVVATRKSKRRRGTSS
ncbi:hypothetical protein AUG19_00235 [archaeon 13_1_20CM_2_54_9]|nr:MAG: hypothetical protein AUG19_00235 [archaeon 13_1_20CM_2_54_9]